MSERPAAAEVVEPARADETLIQMLRQRAAVLDANQQVGDRNGMRLAVLVPLVGIDALTPVT
jgi:hypothetical protein